jgi:hypothetical protein
MQTKFKNIQIINGTCTECRANEYKQTISKYTTKQKFNKTGFKKVHICNCEHVVCNYHIITLHYAYDKGTSKLLPGIKCARFRIHILFFNFSTEVKEFKHFAPLADKKVYFNLQRFEFF